MEQSITQKVVVVLLMTCVLGKLKNFQVSYFHWLITESCRIKNGKEEFESFSENHVNSLTLFLEQSFSSHIFLYFSIVQCLKYLKCIMRFSYLCLDFLTKHIHIILSKNILKHHSLCSCDSYRDHELISIRITWSIRIKGFRFKRELPKSQQWCLWHLINLNLNLFEHNKKQNSHRR